MQANLAYIVENDVIMAAVTRVLTDFTADNVNIKYNARVQNYHLPGVASDLQTQSLNAHLAEIHLEDGQTIYTKLVVRI